MTALFKTIPKFPNMTAYLPPDLSNNGTVYASCS